MASDGEVSVGTDRSRGDLGRFGRAYLTALAMSSPALPESADPVRRWTIRNLLIQVAQNPPPERTAGVALVWWGASR